MNHLSVILLIIAALTALGNIAGGIGALRRKRSQGGRGYSHIPLISLLCCLGAWNFSRETMGFWAFLPAAVDPGTWVLAALPRAIFENFQNKRH